MITELTKEQEAQLAVYRDRAIEVGLAADPMLDEALVRNLTDQARLAAKKLLKTTNFDDKCTEFHVYDSPMEAIRKVPGLNQNNALYGQYDVEWLYLYRYYREVLGLVTETEPLVPLIELASHVGWWWCCATITIVTRRPSEIHMIDKPNGIRVLHNPTGMAIKYANGDGTYALNGLFLQPKYQWLVQRPITYQEALSVDNVEVRNEALKLVADKDKLPKKKLDSFKSKIGGSYVLYELMIGDNRRVYLDGKCPSSKKSFFEAVPPGAKTCKQALNWRENGVLSDDYLEPSIRT